MDEQNRLSSLRAYAILDTPNEPEFDAIVREAAAMMNAPIALISFIDEDRQWFKAKLGIDVEETPRNNSLCSHAIRAKDIFVVEDAADDDRFLGSRLVHENPHVRFYVGAPLTAPNGRKIGMLCVGDVKPRGTPSLSQRARLKLLAEKTMTMLEARKERMRAA